MFGFAALIFIIPALIAPVPLDTDAQGFGYLALTARLGGGFDTLAPFHPEIHYLYSPGFPALVAYLSHQLGLGIQTDRDGRRGGALRLMLVWLAYDFGSELQRQAARSRDGDRHARRAWACSPPTWIRITRRCWRWSSRWRS